MSAAYTAKDIEVLEGLEPVRRRPAMYIGGTDSHGLHHLLWEIVDNSVDEYLNGHATTLEVTLHADGQSITVSDNGRGIPVDKHPKHKRSALELILTTLHAGGKFSDANYIHSGGLHGVGASVVNALSKELVATVRRGGFEYSQTFQRGKPVGELKKIGPARGHGTTIFFQPDDKIFSRCLFVADVIKSRLEDVSHIHRGLEIIFVDETKKERHVLSNPGGIVDYVKKIATDQQKKPVVEAVFHVERQEDGEKIEAALYWTESSEELVRSYANGIRTQFGGAHESGLRAGIAKAVRNYLETHEVPLKGVTITAEDCREGIVGVLSVLLKNPQFQSQTKDRLNNTEMNAAVDGTVRPALENWLNNNPTLSDRIIGRIILAARAREASREAVKEVKRKSATSRRLNLPGKLADCSTNKADEAEIFIVEGDSAGGSAKQGRQARYQAVLPLRGKVLNSEGMTSSKALQHSELGDLVQALGTGVGDHFKIDQLRYQKIILLMDADYDGHHITTLLLTFFFRHLPELIRKGHLYIAKPPLYKIRVGKDQTYWAHDDRHKEEILAGLKANARPEITRFKGLGEMPARTLAETTLDPKTRTLLKVQIESEIDADKTFVTLLGKDPSLRYEFIMSSAGLADDLDI